MSNSNFKLQLDEAEKEIFKEIFLASDSYKVVLKVLEQLTAQSEQALLAAHCNNSPESVNRLICDKIQLQGMKKLATELKQLRDIHARRKQD